MVPMDHCVCIHLLFFATFMHLLKGFLLRPVKAVSIDLESLYFQFILHMVARVSFKRGRLVIHLFNNS